MTALLFLLQNFLKDLKQNRNVKQSQKYRAKPDSCTSLSAVAWLGFAYHMHQPPIKASVSGHRQQAY